MINEPIHPQLMALTEDDLRTLVVSHLAERLRIDPRSIDVREQFSRFGLESRGATDLLAHLAQALGRPLSPVLVWRYPTPEALARHLAGGASEREALVLEERPGAQDEPIAIIGMACRLPGAPSPDAFWQLLREGVSAITEAPRERWDPDALFDPDLAEPGTMNTRWGAFLDRIDGFDPAFFGISPREATTMDPQQRLLLELSWEALEDAGIVAEGLKGSQTGVFFGSIWDDYATLVYQHGARAITQHTVTGHHRSILANRVSYTFGLQGPSMAIDSACSSALVAVHLACESLRRGDATLALAGGVNLNIIPESAIGMSKFGGLSPDGRCFTFDARANGYVRGEGGGVVVLKRLSRALADGDVIYCVIRGCAVNNDGASNGLTAPNPLAQEAMLRLAYRRAGVDPADVQYVELHGTGTELGDPIEASALGTVLGTARPPDRPLLVGSGKTNVGHLEGAAGIVGLLKVVLCIKHRELAPSLNFETPNPHIPLTSLNLQVQRALGPWPSKDGPLLAGVSSFGMGGTNCHAVVSEWPSSETDVFPLSAESPESLRAQAQQWLETIALAGGRARLSSLCSGAAALPLAGEYRLAVTARSCEELMHHLQGFLDGQTRVGTQVGRADPGSAPRVVFVFACQGAQWFSMGLRLLHREPVFRAKIEQCSQLIQQNLGWSLLDELTGARQSSRLDEIDVSIPAIVAIEIAVATQWRAWGIEPAAVLGQSGGEIAAAHVAGALSLEDAMRTICAYGRMLARLRGTGAMGVVGLSWGEAAEELIGHEGRLFRAIQNGADSTVLAGAPDALDTVFRALERRNVFCRRVAIDVAPHCPQVDGLREDLFDALRDVRPRKATIPIVSEVTGSTIVGELFDASHWVRNLCDPAMFSTGIDHLLQDGFDLFVEISPHPIALRAIQSNLHRSALRGVVLPSLRRNEDERGVMLDTLGALYVLGARVRWDRLCSSDPGATRRLLCGDGGEVSPPAAFPVLVSGKTEASLRAQAERLRAHLDAHPDLGLADVAYSLALTRTHFERRAVVVAKSRAPLLDALAALAEGNSAADVVLGETKGLGKLALLFTGQGNQHAGMGRELYRCFPLFRDPLDAVCDHLDVHLDRPLCDVLFATEGTEDASLLDQTAFTQAALFALEVALFRLVEAWGLKPDVLLGHSIGELVAAHVAGVLSLQDACTLVAARARLMQALPQGGAMYSLRASKDDVLPLLVGREARVAVAALNGPLSTVVAGDEDAVIEVTRQVEALGRKCTRLRVSHAFHSPRMDPMLDAFRRVAERLTFHPPRIPIISNLTGKRASADELTSPDYWVRQVRHPVNFLDGVRTLEAEGVKSFLELGPQGVLCAMAQACLSDEALARAALVPALRKDRPECQTLTAAIGGLHARGHELDWNAFFAPFGPRRIELPTYAFQRQRYWLDAPKAPDSNVASAGQVSAEHPLLSAAVSLADAERVVFTGRLSLQSHPWLAGYAVFDTVLLPGTAFVELALAAAHRVGLDRIDELTLEAPLPLPSEGAVHLQLSVGTPDEVGRSALTLHARPEDAPPDTPWTRHATGALGSTAEPAPFDLRAWPPAAATPLDLNGLYDRLAGVGVAYGHHFRGLCAAWRRGDELFAEVCLPDDAAQQADHFGLHPALLDAALHALSFSAGEVALPFSWVGVSLRATGASSLRVRLARRDGEGSVSLAITDALGEPVASVDALRTRPASREQLRSAPASRHGSLYRVKRVTLPKASTASLARDRALTAGHEGQDLDDPATIERILRGILRHVTWRDDAGLESDGPLQSAGVDSLMYLQVLRRAEQTFGVSLSSQAVQRAGASLQSSTLGALTDLILRIRRAQLAQASPDEVRDGAAAPSHVEEEEPALSIERVERDAELTHDLGELLGPGAPLETLLVTLSSGETIETLCAGAGAPLVLLPPIMASIPIWVFQIEELRRDFRVIVPNHPGYGRSKTPRVSLSPARIAGRVAAVLDGLGVQDPVHLVGWSLGGLVAQELSLALPRRVRSLSLVNTTSRLEEEDSLRNMEDMLRRLVADLRRTPPGEHPSTLARRAAALEASQREAGYERSLDYLAEVLRFNASDRIRSISAPTLVVQGGEDTLTVPRYGRHMAREIPGAQYHELDRGGHYVPLHLPRAFNDLLRSFLHRWSA